MSHSRFVSALVVGLTGLFASVASGSDAAFVEKVNLDKFRLVAVQHQGRFKTFDTLARSTIRRMSGSDVLNRALPGDEKPLAQDAAFTYLDLLFRPQTYNDVRMVYVKETYLRDALTWSVKDKVDKDTLNAILKDGKVSLSFLTLPEVRAKLDELSRDVIRTARKVDILTDSAGIADPRLLERLMRVIPPPQAASDQDRWFSVEDLRRSAPQNAAHAGMGLGGLPGMSEAVQQDLQAQWNNLSRSWQASDAAGVNAALDALSGLLPRVAPHVYPPASKLSLEHWYYKWNKMMWSWVFYFFAVVMLLMGIVYRWPRALRAGLWIFALGFFLHTVAVGIRWYLAGRIPNTNMFEAVTAAAWFGAAMAIFLEFGPSWLGRRSAWQVFTAATIGGFAVWLGVLLIQGTPIDAWQQWGPVPIAALIIHAVGCMGLISLSVARRMASAHGLPILAASAAAMVALMCGQFMKVSLDSDIGRAMPVLNDLWLYVHTNMIIASYALIGMAFVTGALYVVGRLLTTPIDESWQIWMVILFFTIVIPAPAFPDIAHRVLGWMGRSSGAPWAPAITIESMMAAWSPFLILLGMYVVAYFARLFWRRSAGRAYAAWEGLPIGVAGVVGAAGRMSPGSLPPTASAATLPDTRGEPEQREGLRKILDLATMLLLELSFITLWTGIIMGAIWADHSWGRPWGWDPKEVFALNTWIIFLILVHVRLKVKDKELWTAVLAVIGAAVMLFNWVVVNFFITGLHSYA